MFEVLTGFGGLYWRAVFPEKQHINYKHIKYIAQYQSSR